ncbi:MAG: DUF1593 domain-containing protein [Prolixibacteraceae bacterium]|nr:DUF1593 domain-containing protein [Prolixibacteraceae bacterium]
MRIVILLANMAVFSVLGNAAFAVEKSYKNEKVYKAAVEKGKMAVEFYTKRSGKVTESDYYADICAFYGSCIFGDAIGDSSIYQGINKRYNRATPIQTTDIDQNSCGILPLHLYLHSKNAQQLKLGTDAADANIINGGHFRNAIDDMYMTGSLLVQAYRAIGDEKYLDFCADYSVRYIKALQQNNGLYKHGANGSQQPWGRGNGWAAAGNAELLQILPENHQRYEEVVSGFQKHMKGLIAVQLENGMWQQLLGSNDSRNWEETSGTSMFVFALFTGMELGILDEETFLEPAKRGWMAVANYLSEDGKLKNSASGFWPDAGTPENYLNAKVGGEGDSHGTAGFIWAATSVVRYYTEDASQLVNTMEKTRLSSPTKNTSTKYIKPRIINTTDLGADPDDEQSMVRQLVCANEFDIEGLIVSTGCWKKSQSNTDMLDKIVDAYGEVYSNLIVHAEGYPTPEYLRAISVMGQTGYGMSDVGTGKDSPGSELIIASVDKDDPRPLWVMGWGGMNNIAQAIWKVRETRSPEELKKFLGKLRLFDILGQDDAGAWIAKNFPEVFYIRATGVYGWQSPKNGAYYTEHIQNHGPLGAVYPDTKWAPEGDTPAFMHVYPNGLNDPEQIDQGGWGGRFSFEKQAGIRSMSEVHKIQEDGETRFDPYFMYGNTPEESDAIKRWSDGYNNDFAARMDWSITSNYEDANHHPIAVLNGEVSRQILTMTTRKDTEIELSAAGSCDPDGDSLHYLWSFYAEPGTYQELVTISNNSSQTATIKIPEDAVGKSIHIVLTIHDDGSPNLYSYRRMIINVQP